jgi:hypothetical protein
MFNGNTLAIAEEGNNYQHELQYIHFGGNFCSEIPGGKLMCKEMQVNESVNRTSVAHLSENLAFTQWRNFGIGCPGF